MQKWIVVMLTVAFGFVVSVPAFADDPSLIAVNVTFKLPKGDDKDDDSSLDVSIVKGDTVIAEQKRIGSGTTFGDPGTYGPFPIPLKNAVKKPEYTGSTTKLHINTVGNDTFCAEIHVDALFSDNTHMYTSSGPTIKISEKNRDAQFQNQ